MYRKKDFETINLNIDKIKTDAIVEYKKNYEPTITEQVTVYNSIKKFIITKKIYLRRIFMFLMVM
mgnify:CR=1 FL=1